MSSENERKKPSTEVYVEAIKVERDEKGKLKKIVYAPKAKLLPSGVIVRYTMVEDGSRYVSVEDDVEVIESDVEVIAKAGDKTSKYEYVVEVDSEALIDERDTEQYYKPKAISYKEIEIAKKYGYDVRKYFEIVERPYISRVALELGVDVFVPPEQSKYTAFLRWLRWKLEDLVKLNNKYIKYQTEYLTEDFIKQVKIFKPEINKLRQEVKSIVNEMRKIVKEIAKQLIIHVNYCEMRKKGHCKKCILENLCAHALTGNEKKIKRYVMRHFETLLRRVVDELRKIISQK